ncbi:hypothetical protein [Sorangium cellulosum]|uniref:hypothetical protein n=1 Tax=Sorangium cellulosum TaxID=56 RepID=UPI0012FF862E|nr:hypothetical protein [Sorangium cellulosum]
MAAIEPFLAAIERFVAAIEPFLVAIDQLVAAIERFAGDAATVRTFVTLFCDRIAQSDIQPEQEFDELALQASRVEAFVEHVDHDRAEFADVRIDLRVRAEFVRDESQPAALCSGSAAERGA